jgi:hypothetical protein
LICINVSQSPTGYLKIDSAEISPWAAGRPAGAIIFLRALPPIGNSNDSPV